MAFFGWLSKRRGQKRIEQLPPVPGFRATMDCTPWVLDGLWPSELNAAGPDSDPLAGYLERDLRRIADSANQRLRVIAAAGLDEDTRRAEESRVFNVARAFATVRPDGLDVCSGVRSAGALDAVKLAAFMAALED